MGFLSCMYFSIVPWRALVYWNIGKKWTEKYLCTNNCSMITTIWHSIPKITTIAYIVRVGFFHMSGITVSWEYSIRNFVSKDDILIEWQQRYAVIYNVRKIQNEVIQAWLSLLGLFIRFHPFFSSPDFILILVSFLCASTKYS